MRYIDIIRALHDYDVRFVVVGGVAVVLHGVPRLTFDLDLLVDLTRENITRLVSALEGLGFKSRLPISPLELADDSVRRAWIAERNLKAFNFWHDEGDEVDLCLTAPVTYDQARADAVVAMTEGTPVPVASIDVLTRMKKEAARPQDLSDVTALEQVRRILAEGSA